MMGFTWAQQGNNLANFSLIPPMVGYREEEVFREHGRSTKFTTTTVRV